MALYLLVSAGRSVVLTDEIQENYLWEPLLVFANKTKSVTKDRMVISDDEMTRLSHIL